MKEEGGGSLRKLLAKMYVLIVLCISYFPLLFQFLCTRFVYFPFWILTKQKQVAEGDVQSRGAADEEQ